MFYVLNTEKVYTHNIALYINLPAKYTAVGRDLDPWPTTCHSNDKRILFEAYQLKAHSILLRLEAPLDLYNYKWLNWDL